MILLDTNVVSELMRSEPEATVETWIAGQPPKELFLSTVSEAELRYGAAILPEGRRRRTLFSDIESMLRKAFGDRVLPFDQEAARVYERGHVKKHDSAVERLHDLAECHGADLLHVRSWIVTGESPARGRTLADLLAWCVLTEG